MKNTRIDTERSFTHEHPDPDTKPPNLSIKKKYQFYSVKLTSVFSDNFQNNFVLDWRGNQGFGQIKFCQDHDDDFFYIDTEFMSEEFVIAVLTKLVEDAILEA